MCFLCGSLLNIITLLMYAWVICLWRDNLASQFLGYINVEALPSNLGESETREWLLRSCPVACIKYNPVFSSQPRAAEPEHEDTFHFRSVIEFVVRSGPIWAHFSSRTVLCRYCLLALCTSQRNGTSRGSRSHLSLMTRRDASTCLSFHQISTRLIVVLILSPQSKWNLIQ
jgi:hypothetical protein